MASAQARTQARARHAHACMQIGTVARSHDRTGVWVRGCVGARVCGWARGCVAARVRGCVEAWVRGCMGAWVHGCVGAW
eukprot:467625-Alexandrium_andersonii.AAC.1